MGLPERLADPLASERCVGVPVELPDEFAAVLVAEVERDVPRIEIERSAERGERELRLRGGPRSLSRAAAVSVIVRLTPCFGGVNFRTFAFHCRSTMIVSARKSICSHASASSSPVRVPWWTATSR